MKYLKGVIKMMNYFFMGLIIVALLGGTSSAMSILRPFSGGSNKIVVPVEKSKSERSIRCKGKAEVNDKGQVISCSEGFYLDEESENSKERKMNAKERVLAWFGNFKGLFFWLVLGSIGASLLGFGGLVASFWSNLFGSGIKMAKATFKGIQNFKRNGKKLKKKDQEIYDEAKKDLVKEIQTQQQIAGVEHKVNKVRAKID